VTEASETATLPRMAPVAALVAIEVYALWRWLQIGRSAWFYHDEWDFISRRTAGDLGDLFRPHNGHWTTLPLIAYRIQYRLFGAREYFSYRLLIVVLYLTVASLLFVVLRRANVNPWIAVAAVAAFSLLGPGWENVVRPFQITFVGSLALGLTQLVLVDHPGPFDRRDWWGLVAGLLGLMTSAISLVMVFVVGVALFLRRRRRVALLETVPLALTYLCWLIAIGHKGMQTVGPTGSGPLRSARTDIPGFIGAGLRGTYDALGLPGVLRIIPVVFLVAGVGLIVRGGVSRGRLDVLAAPIALLAGFVVFLLFTAASGRSDFPPHYISICVVLSLPVLVVALDAIARRWHWFVLVAILVLVVGIPRNVHQAVVGSAAFVPEYQASKHVLAALAADPLLRQAPPDLRPEPNAANWLTAGWLRTAATERRVPVARLLTRQDLDSDRFRLSFVERTFDGSLTRCRPMRHARVLSLRNGDALDLAGHGISVTPVTTRFHVSPTLIFTQGSKQVVFVLRDAGPVHVKFFSAQGGLRGTPLRVCVRPE
jgi:hypothetical protein